MSARDEGRFKILYVGQSELTGIFRRMIAHDAEGVPCWQVRTQLPVGASRRFR